MRLCSDFLVAAVTTALLSCTVSNFQVAGVPTFGRTQDVSIADIEAAISAYKTSESEKVGPAEVISHDEIRIYQDSECRNYTSMVRVKGKWQLGSVVLVHPRY
jgi:hypothetical protein